MFDYENYWKEKILFLRVRYHVRNLATLHGYYLMHNRVAFKGFLCNSRQTHNGVPKKANLTYAIVLYPFFTLGIVLSHVGLLTNIQHDNNIWVGPKNVYQKKKKLITFWNFKFPLEVSYSNFLNM